MKRVQVRAPADGCFIPSTAGASVAIPANGVKEIRLAQAQRYLAAGCALVEPADETQNEARSDEPEGEDRRQMIRDALNEMVARGDTNDFVSTGDPRVANVNKLLPFRAEREEVLSVFAEIME